VHVVLGARAVRVAASARRPVRGDRRRAGRPARLGPGRCPDRARASVCRTGPGCTCRTSVPSGHGSPHAPARRTPRLLRRVDRAVLIVEKALEAYGAPVYVRHEIVHNTHVVESLRRKGAVFVEDETEVPEGAVIVFSAHGSPPEAFENSRRLGHT
jgi:hypothetical protein